MNIKTISIVLALQIATALSVFLLTRSYYLDQPKIVDNTSPPSNSPALGESTQALIDSLQNHPQLQIQNSEDPAEVDRQANEAFLNGDYPTAARLYQRVIELAPHQAEPHNNLGLTLHYLGRSEEALEILHRGVELGPEFQRIWLTLGFVQSGVGNIEAAKQAFNRAIELGPDLPPGKSAQEMLNKLP